MNNRATLICRLTAAVLVLVDTTQLVYAETQIDPQPWISSLGNIERSTSILSVSADASVNVSDGLTYDVALRYRDPQIAVFHRDYGHRRITMGVDGQFVWSFDGEVETDVSIELKDMILGHQMQAQLLFFDRINPGESSLEAVSFNGCDCMAYSRTEAGKRPRTMIFDRESLLPVAMKIFPGDPESVLFEYNDWRDVEGVRLPFAIDIDDGERRFAYRFSNIRFDAQDLDAMRAPYETLSDENKLLRLHRRVIEAHLNGDITLIEENWGANTVMVNRGEVVRQSGTEAADRLGESLARRNHNRYDDMIRPIVRVSDDGTIGWVIAQIEAEGVRLDEVGNSFDPPQPFYFTAAWVALYENFGTGWRLVGNVSNVRSK